MVCAVSESTRVDVTMFSSAPSTLWLYVATSVRAQDHLHPLAGCAPPPTRWRRIASRKCEEPFRGDVNPLSSGPTSRDWFPGYVLVSLSQKAIVAVLHCHRCGQFFVQAYEMSMNKEGRSTLSGPMPPLWGAWGVDRCAGQVAMAIDRSGRRTMPTDGVGSPIGCPPSGLRADVGTESRTVRPLHGAPRGDCGVEKGGKDGEE